MNHILASLGDVSRFALTFNSKNIGSQRRDRNEALYHLSHALVCGREDRQRSFAQSRATASTRQRARSCRAMPGFAVARRCRSSSRRMSRLSLPRTRRQDLGPSLSLGEQNPMTSPLIRIDGLLQIGHPAVALSALALLFAFT